MRLEARSHAPSARATATATPAATAKRPPPPGDGGASPARRTSSGAPGRAGGGARAGVAGDDARRAGGAGASRPAAPPGPGRLLQRAPPGRRVGRPLRPVAAQGERDGAGHDRRHVGRRALERRGVLRGQLPEEALRRVGLVRRAPGQRLVEDGRQRPQVGARVDLVARGLLGAHVAQGADDPPRLGHVGARVAARRLGDPEVEEPHVPVVGQHDVVGLEVAVDDPRRVRLGQRLERLLPERQDLRRRRPPGPRQPRRQRLAAHEVHGQVEPPVGLLAVVAHDDRVLVHERLPGRDLPQEARPRRRVAQEVAVHELERHLAPVERLPRAVDGAHGARAEPLEQGVLPGHDAVYLGVGRARGEPGVEVARQVVGARVPRRRVARHRPQDDRLERRVDRRVPRPRRGRPRLDDLAQDLEHGRPVEGRLADERVVEERAQAVDVGARVHALAVLDLLRRHVAGAAQAVARGRQRRAERVVELGHAVVEEPRRPARLDDHVARLEVAVDDALPVEERHGARDVAHDADRVLPRAGRVAVDEVLERLARHQVHDEEGLPGGRHAGGVRGHDPLVAAQARGHDRLALEAPRDLGRRPPRAQELHGARAVSLEVPRLPDHPHAAARDQPHGPVARAEVRRGVEGLGRLDHEAGDCTGPRSWRRCCARAALVQSAHDARERLGRGDLTWASPRRSPSSPTCTRTSRR
ncbi:MAG: hypothetical protein M9894_27345 [Planctomycetes bacterium]|nr:hypothetical protein [Planctomycetota bacterium]